MAQKFTTTNIGLIVTTGLAIFALFHWKMMQDAIKLGYSDITIARANVIANASTDYYDVHHEWPISLDDLTAPDSENGGKGWVTPAHCIDAWGKPFNLVPLKGKANGVRVYTTNPDGKVISSETVYGSDGD